jgi:SAM-dependent methyltransferase
MKTSEAVELIRGAIPGGGGTWADLGCGEGTFTKALAELLGPGSRTYAVDRNAAAIAAVKRWVAREQARVVPVVADFTRPFDLPGPDEIVVDGLLFANALHFVPEAEGVLARLAAWLRPGGRVVIVEYDRRPASRWVPYPIPVERLPALAAAARLSTPVIKARRASAFGGNLYVATAERSEPAGQRAVNPRGR